MHDGNLEALTHNSLSRTIVLTWDVPYLRAFHQLSEQTRFGIELHGVQEMQVLEFQPWPGSTDMPRELSWDEQQAKRQADAKKATYTSRDWQTFVGCMVKNKFECSDASLDEITTGASTLSLDLADYTLNDYPTVRFVFETSRFVITPNISLSLVDFVAMGEAYWNDFAARSEELKG